MVSDPRLSTGLDPAPDGDDPLWLSTEESAAWLALSAFTIKISSALDSQLQRDAGLSMFEYMVMAVLSESADRSLQMSDLAQLTSASLSRLSHTAKRLEGDGYLTRSRCPGSGRRTTAKLTDAGYRKVVQSAPGHVAAVRDLLIDVVSPQQLAAVREVCESVIDRIEAGSGDCPAGPDDPAAPLGKEC